MYPEKDNFLCKEKHKRSPKHAHCDAIVSNGLFLRLYIFNEISPTNILGIHKATIAFIIRKHNIFDKLIE